jgi:Tc toxin complex TcA C-terminal TcB-binding domain/Neuraminidase-like domain
MDSIELVNSSGLGNLNNIQVLHRALSALGFTIDETEIGENQFGRTTIQAVRAIERAAGLAVDYRAIVSAATAAEINRRLVFEGLIDGPAKGPAECFLVEGIVRGSDGVAVQGLSIQVFDQDLRSREVLGSATTDPTGRYAVSYRADQFKRAEKGFADLVVVVKGQRGAKALYESEIQFNAPSRLVHDVKLDVRGPSLYEGLVTSVEPLAEQQKVRLDEIDENERFRDITFLTGETGFDAATITALAVAARLAKLTGLDQAMLFASIMSGVWVDPASNSGVPARNLDERAKLLRSRFSEPTREQLKERLLVSVQSGIVDASNRRIEDFIEALLTFAAKDEGGGLGNALTHNLLRDLLGEDAKHVERYLSGAPSISLVLQLRADADIPKPISDRVAALVQLNSALLGDHDLMKHLARDVTTEGHVRKLARLESKDWMGLLEKSGKMDAPVFITDGGGDIKRYCEVLAARFKSDFPTQALVGDMERDDKTPHAMRLLGQFLDSEPLLDFGEISLNRFAQGLSKRDTRKKGFLDSIEQLKPLQRLYKVAPNYAAVKALNSHGIKSAQSVYRRGQDAVVDVLKNQAGMTHRSAQLAYESASATAAVSLQVAVSLVAESESVGTPIMGALSIDTGAIPELGSLFRLGNDCACSDCSSVLSPAAYLADLLLFLSNRSVGGGRTAKDVLLSRRPDVAWIDLNCDNAFTPLPYVDLAIEAMEDLVAPYKLGTAATGSLPTDNADHPVPAQVVAAFASFVPPIVLGAAARVTSTGTNWVLRDQQNSYRIISTGDVWVLRNTHGTPAERELMPEYLSAPANNAILGKTFPWTLPLDSAGTETRLSLSKLGVERDQLMRALRGPAAPNSPTNLDIAAAQLGISSAVATLVVSPSANPGPHWGTSTVNQAIAKHTSVPNFLAATGLSFADLLRLLSLPYANTAGALLINHLDDSCDLDQKEIQGLNASHLDRLHRFLRLTKATGGSLYEADLMVRRFGTGGVLSAPTDLVVIADAIRLRKLLGEIEVEELTALFSTIPIEDRFHEAFEPLLPSLYNRLFLDPLVHRPVNAAFAVSAVTAAAPAALIAQHRPTVLAALQISSAELDSLVPLCGPQVSLSNLSILFRHARIARALDLTVNDWLVFARLVGGDPFTSPADLIRTIDLIARARSLGVETSLLPYLLEARLDAPGALLTSSATEILGGLRTTLQKIADDTSIPIPNIDRQALIDRLAPALSSLDPDSSRPARILEIVENRFLSRTEIDPAPAQPAPSAPIHGLTAVVDGTKLVLSFTGMMNPATKALLKLVAQVGPIATVPAWAIAIDELEQQGRLHIATVSTRFEAPLVTLPAGLALPGTMKRRIRHLAVRGVIQFDGVMTSIERTALQTASADAAWTAAITSLFDQPRANPVPVAQRLADFNTWQFSDTADSEAISEGKILANLNALLAVILPRACAVESEDAVNASLSAATELDRDSTQNLLRRISLGGGSLLSWLTIGAGFVETTSSIAPASFQKQFQSVDLLYRVSRIVAIFQMRAREIDLITTLSSATNSDILPFSAMPLAYGAAAPASPPPPAYSQFALLIFTGELLLLDRKTARKPIRLLGLMAQILSDPTTVSMGPSVGKLDLFATAENSLGWSGSDVATLTAAGAGLGLVYPIDFRNSKTWLSLSKALAAMRPTRLAAADGLKLCAGFLSDAEATIARQAMRVRLGSKFNEAGRQVQDAIRTLRRDALCDYLINYVSPGTAALPASPTGGWRKPTDVFAYLLIDPKMGACQMTSRIVQATIAVQTFVNRCFMGFEPEVSPEMANDGRWDQWNWMNAYQLWRANRNVFLFPENWLEPEFRRNKSYAFKEMEDDLLQTELSEDSARDAFLNYIDKLDQVANVDVTGVHWEDGKGKGRGAYHVVGRTAGQEPHAYFYRRFEYPAERWTPWSKIELDLKSAPVVPFMLDQRTFLVWPEFREQKPDTGSSLNVPSAGGGIVPVERARIATGVALSELRNGKWTPKKVSAEFMPAIEQQPFIYPQLQDVLSWTPLDLRRLDPKGQFYFEDLDARAYSKYNNVYEFLGCRGYPELATAGHAVQTVDFYNMQFRAARDVEVENVEELVARGTSTYGSGTMILRQTPDRIKITFPHHFNSFDLNTFESLNLLFSFYFGSRGPTGDGKLNYLTTGTRAPWIFADKGHTFFVEPVSALPDGRIFTGWNLLDLARETIDRSEPQIRPWLQLIMEVLLWNDPFKRLRFSMFYHPQVCTFREALLSGGVAKLLSRPTQFSKGDLNFGNRYDPVDSVVLRDNSLGNNVYHPVEDVDFSSRGAYSQYNWELFYHAPFLVGTQLMKAGRHKEAMGWLRHIFDPSGADGKDPTTGVTLGATDKRRFWITRPFFERENAGYQTQRIDKILNLLANSSASGPDVAARKELIQQVATWRDNPFDPHLVASTRDIAYQKAAFIRFAENLITWGDKLFAKSDVESVMAGGALYLYAKSFIGDKPEVVPPRAKPQRRTYAEIERDIDAFGNALVSIEDLLPALPPVGPPQDGPALPSVLYFCIPRNEKLLALWDLVDDRVMKYQNCLDLMGQPRKTSLFAPPIDPAAAIAAMAAGVGAGDLLSELSAPLPPHRIQTYLQKANELVGDLKAFGGALLSALEKKDGEAMALLRQTHELKQLDAVRAVKAAAILDAGTTVTNLEFAQEMARARNTYYKTREFMSAGEKAAIGLNTASLVISAGAAVADTLGGVLAAIPNFNVGASGFGGSPHVSASTGGMSFSKALELASRALSQTAGIVDKTAGMVSTVAGYQRRHEDWLLQASTSALEIEQYASQIAGAKIRLENTQRELANHDLQVENSKAVDEFMRSKYTKKELYSWMAGEVSKTFFESYKLAYSYAKLAERCYCFDQGLITSSIIGFGAWDSNYRGIQSGERLQLDLRRLEATYLAANKRYFELTKNVSLAMSAPVALIELRRYGRCQIELPEELFDLDYPGHYFRRIKSVSVSIPCVTGSNTTVACTVRLVRNSIRTNTQLPSGITSYPRRMQNGISLDDNRFRDEQVPVSAIATSSAQNDSGMFEFTMKDDRFLPFEGAGVISRWSVELVEEHALRTFDYDSIADVILHIKYTSREEGGAFKAASITNARNQLSGSQSRLEMRRVFRVSSDFSSEWTAFRNPAPGVAPELMIHLDPMRFPGGKELLIKLRSVQLMAEYPPSAPGNEPDLEFEVGTPPLAAVTNKPLVNDLDDTCFAESEETSFGPSNLPESGVEWRFRFRQVGEPDFSGFSPGTLRDLYLVVGYTVQSALP